MRRVWMLGGAALVAACAGGIRPAYEPFPQAVQDTVSASPSAVVTALSNSLVTEGVLIQWQSAAEGYVETQWYDLVNRRSGNFDRGAPERFVRLRFFVDSLAAGRSRIFAEVVSLGSIDTSRPEREREMMVPPGTAGFVLLQRVLRTAEQALGG